MTAFVMFSFRNFAIQMTGFNNAVSYNLKNALTGTYPDYEVDFAKVLVSRGDLPNGSAPGATASAGNVVFSWTDNSGTGRARATDKSLLLVYCPTLNMSIYVTEGADRSAGTDTVNVSTFSGETVHTYISFISEDGRDVASSIYTGEFTIA